MDKLKLLLWPFAALYGGVTSLRNTAYNQGWFASRKFNLPVIAVGNLTVGGTGKTPHVEYLLRLLHNYRVATLSRGYKRSTKGFVLADENATAATIGDEPFQYHADFQEVQVAVSEKRVEGVEQLLQLSPKPEVIVLDDAMQHRAIQPSLNLLVTDYNRLFYKDHMLPAGLLREPKNGARRADAVLVSKCPVTIQASEMNSITSRIHKHCNSETPVFFTGFRYGQPVPIGNAGQLSKHIVLLTGIANADPLKHYLKEHQFKLLHHASFPDHYMYSASDMAHIKKELKKHPKDTIVLTTRKDAVKLMDASLQNYSLHLPLFYIPIEVYFVSGDDDFNELVLQHVKSYTGR
ncbi:tetraacyldisaccharide 4'-kinase [Pontibacter sp. BT310]|uniref:Tetraacyldisaccharide 4'-kinase n=1 Tax=Pontibacter populi TaxID=890055 RepID=A0ABS6XI04_9BACT|nr:MULTISPECIES: tetraacyldisaccharide 4'-kinase [Pontibacter]MBJ6119992.1 tetraacyldisaccharide 4'-kinase [Pontibacter sp. BT310]MBR0572421.1 tetraacyldisaccharide 4'-kinase [Microvirga sp. STS03]MBW3366845.1 tetraacyldisaccharide 4'-kinase [Pontibacter populi]